jgi:hypothetical protein
MAQNSPVCAIFYRFRPVFGNQIDLAQLNRDSPLFFGFRPQKKGYRGGRGKRVQKIASKIKK